MSTSNESPEPLHQPNHAASSGRLQRPAANDGTHISSFRQVLRRHGLTMGLCALVGLVLPNALDRIQATTLSSFASPLSYLAATLALGVFLAFYQARRGHPPNLRNSLWIVYLLYISLVEELAFRLLFPMWLGESIHLTGAIVVSNLIFAGIHYITLRWHWWNCLFVFAGGMGFSHMLANYENLTLVILTHWFFTFLNTPTPPRGS
ncbi:MAG: CPBP family intramembrane metalloprotease [Gammaproteobacteria bacterium TMED243]|nr:MAG: CPBP family intramembrane metalloprotease [Gammaproteobacteria bacterium TMED243]